MGEKKLVGTCIQFNGINSIGLEFTQYYLSSSDSEEQGGFRRGRGCVDQIFVLYSHKSVVEKYIGKDKRLYAAFMDLEKVYDRVNSRALAEVLLIYVMGVC